MPFRIKNILFIIFTFVITSNSVAQNQTKVDSLLQVLKTKITNKQKVDVFNSLAKIFSGTDSTETINYANQAIELAKEIDYTMGFVEAHYQTAWMLMEKGHHQKAIDLLKKTLPITLSNKHPNEEARIYRGLGVIYMYKGNYPKAIEYHQKCIEIEKLLENKENLSSGYKAISQVYYNQGNYQKALEYVFESLKLAEETENKNSISDNYANIAIIQSKQGNFSQSLDYHFKALKLTEKYGDKKDLVYTIISIGSTYRKLGNYPKALQYFLKSLKISEEIEYKIGIAKNYNNIGGILNEQGKADEALEYFLKSLKIKEELGQKRSVASSCNNIGVIYHKQNDYNQSLTYHLKALKIRKELGDKRGLASSSLNIGNVYLSKKEYTLSSKYCQQSLLISQEIGNKSILAKAYNALGEIHLKLKNYSKAKNLITQGVAIAKELRYLSAVQYGSKLLSETQKALGNHKAALESYELYHATYDSLLGEEKSKQLSQLQLQYETEKKEQEIKSLAQQASIQSLQLKQANFNKTIFGIVSVVFLLVGLVLYLVNRQKQLALKQRAQDIEQNLLRVQMNPHFIFNAMTSIQDYMNQGDAKKASLYLVKFSKLIRQVLDNSRSEFISLDQEINMLDNYLSIQNLKRDHPFTFEIEVEEDLDIDEIAIPPMFAQPFVENAIEHGIANIEDRATITIHFSMQGDHLVLKIADNGSGIEEAMKIKRKDHVSHAIKITEERIDLYRKMRKKKIAFDIQNLSQGTQITFNLPFQYI